MEYKTVTFQAQRSPRTPYMPPEEGGLPDDSTDLAWEDLYKGECFRLGSSIALANYMSNDL